MSKPRSHFLTFVMTLLGGLAIAAAGCGGDGARGFGNDSGMESGGRSGSTGGDTGASGGRVGSSGGAIGSGGDTATGGAGTTGGATGTASGGMVGSGGRPSTGGTTGSGGMVGSGGRPSTGGTTGTSSGGMVGSGGRPSTGGTTGSGGMVGSGGSTGTGGTSASVCDGIAADYQKELPTARACNPALSVLQCQTSAPSALGCGSNCIIYVQDNSRLTELQKKWNSNGCPNMIRVCPAIACVDAKPGNCYATTTGGATLCQVSPRS